MGSRVGDMQLRRSQPVRFNLSLFTLISVTSVEARSNHHQDILKGCN